MQFLGAQFLPGVCPLRQKAHLLAQRIHIIDRLGNMLVKNLHLKSNSKGQSKFCRMKFKLFTLLLSYIDDE